MEEKLTEDQEYMQQAIDEAVKGLGRTSPNPLVGAVIVRNGSIVGRGHHKKAGDAHAEINALADAGSRSQGATIYVTLEPCNHFGRTAPCTQAIIKSGIRRVVVGMPDPNPTVEGGGNNCLLQQGLDVSSGILEGQCRAINRPFIKWVTKKTPWVIVKAGVSLDGRIAPANNQKLWITNEKSRRHVHHLRDQVDAILVGIGTVLVDNPSLTTRIPGKVTKDPLRVILDTHLRLPPDAKLLRQESTASTIVFTGAHVADDHINAFSSMNVDIERIALGSDGQIDLKMVLDSLAKKQVTSILVEGGCRVHTSFIKNSLADQVMLFYGPLFIGDQGVPLICGCAKGSPVKFPRLKDVTTSQFDNDILIEGLVETTCSQEL